MSENALGSIFSGAANSLNLGTTAASEPASEPNGDGTVHNVIIVGSGPAGYTAAIYTARANLSPLLFASSISPGGDLMTTTEVENFPGFIEGIQGPELMANIGAQAERFGADIRYEDVASVELEGPVKKVILTDGSVFLAKTVIMSTGSEYRKLGVDGEQRLSGHGVSWCATCDGFFFKEKALAVIGGGDSAFEEALFLTSFASKVYLVHRRDTFRASDIMQKRALTHEKIEIILDSEVKTINGEDKVSSLTLTNVKTGTETQLEVEGVFVAIGSDPRTDLVKDQLELSDAGTIAVQGRSSRTSIDGVFAAGDVIDPIYRQAITAAGSGCVAAIDAQHYLESL
ncbi:thioredoxin-disulfide reductase [Rothia sp. (in: high G+C Gram-positive bacteria)]|uniref:thioredoxin-disulfide reductase n=1 Tax=Rothia sp. (in: high G+C Gram-positive bacteria) TaxID=1885016 RepID=UPI000EF0B61E|nr:thioredoxin-disulfide reductase [Rothia sp. (in: high G+C Gram-positive bacteria)]